jgi:alkyl hydroperoxide reductase subunit AhpC
MTKKVLSSFLFLIISFNLHASVAVGDMAPDFTLKNEKGEKIKLSDFKGELIVLEWMNHGCPFVKKHYNSGNMQKLQKKYQDKVQWFSIISSAPGKQGFSTPDQALADKKEKKSHAKHILLDTSGEVGQNYEAKTTPHMFIIGKDFKLKYMGAIDSEASTDEDDISGADNYVDLALKELLNNKAVSKAKTRPYGCSVKY